MTPPANRQRFKENYHYSFHKILSTLRRRFFSGKGFYAAGVAMGSKTIGTHNGKFHADEAFACALLSMTKEFADASI